MDTNTLDYFSLVANIAEISALVLVLITIFLISQEIKETRRIFTANAHSQIGISAAEFLATIYKDKELHRTWAVGLDDISLLDETQQSRFYMVLLAYWTLLANGYYQAQVDSSIVSRIEGMLDLMMTRKTVRDWWQAGQYNPSPEFEAYVNNRVEVLTKMGIIESPSSTVETEEDSKPDEVTKAKAVSAQAT